MTPSSKPIPSPKSTLRSGLRSANWAIAHLPGLSESDAQKLHAISITTTHQLLSQAWTPLAQEALAGRLNVHVKHVQKWVALADLARVPSVGYQFCGLLLHAGVATVERLALTQASILHRQILKLQVTMLQRPDLCPSAGQVDRWIQEAKQLVRASRR